jgi:hypothetical protein
MLRNGLGSIRNLELLIKSIKVGQKGLFAAVAAVHSDCAPMIANAVGLAKALADGGVERGCADRLSSALATSLTDLESMLATAVDAGRLSVSQRLRLERDLARCARDLGSTLPLISLIERASRPPPDELTPADLIHASSAERPDQNSVDVERGLSRGADHVGLRVDLEAAKMLVAVGVALVVDGNPEAQARIGFESQPGGALMTTVGLGRPPAGLRGEPSKGEEGGRVRIAALRISASSLMCAEVAARSLGARFEHDRDAHRVCIYWPLS